MENARPAMWAHRGLHARGEMLCRIEQSDAAISIRARHRRELLLRDRLTRSTTVTVVRATRSAQAYTGSLKS
jgi:hypothetical protein